MNHLLAVKTTKKSVMIQLVRDALTYLFLSSE